jgi:hypothetical protein
VEVADAIRRKAASAGKAVEAAGKAPEAAVKNVVAIEKAFEASEIETEGPKKATGEPPNRFIR